MEHKPQTPERHSELRDPKLPVIHGAQPRAEQHRIPAPRPQAEL